MKHSPFSPAGVAEVDVEQRPNDEYAVIFVGKEGHQVEIQLPIEMAVRLWAALGVALE